VPELAQQPTEALAGERRLRDLAAAVGRPEGVVDAAVGRERRGRAAEPELAERAGERGALGRVEVEQRAVDVEQDGAEAGQGYLAR
jgi:hypothetical protein